MSLANILHEAAQFLNRSSVSSAYAVAANLHVNSRFTRESIEPGCDELFVAEILDKQGDARHRSRLASFVPTP